MFVLCAVRRIDLHPMHYFFLAIGVTMQLTARIDWGKPSADRFAPEKVGRSAVRPEKGVETSPVREQGC